MTQLTTNEYTQIINNINKQLQHTSDLPIKAIHTEQLDMDSFETIHKLALIYNPDPDDVITTIDPRYYNANIDHMIVQYNNDNHSYMFGELNHVTIEHGETGSTIAFDSNQMIDIANAIQLFVTEINNAIK